MFPRLNFLTQPYNVLFPRHQPKSPLKNTGMPSGNLGALFNEKVEKTFFQLVAPL